MCDASFLELLGPPKTNRWEGLCSAVGLLAPRVSGREAVLDCAGPGTC